MPTPTPTHTSIPPTETAEPTATETATPEPTATPTPMPSDTPTPEPESADTSSDEGTGGGEGLSTSVELPAAALPGALAAASDLAARLGADISSVNVLEIAQMEWSDSSLGCPQPETLYAQVITPGYLIVMESGGQLFNYHTDLLGTVILCEK